LYQRYHAAAVDAKPRYSTAATDSAVSGRSAGERLRYHSSTAASTPSIGTLASEEYVAARSAPWRLTARSSPQTV